MKRNPLTNVPETGVSQDSVGVTVAGTTARRRIVVPVRAAANSTKVTPLCSGPVRVISAAVLCNTAVPSSASGTILLTLVRRSGTTESNVVTNYDLEGISLGKNAISALPVTSLAANDTFVAKIASNNTDATNLDTISVEIIVEEMT